ncbi:hypothetical protein [Aquamicrobium sp. LC103]|uniref:hypothetical protein n=1 Tax=Aquamicrobium sp. LC103 TaxID=1120658 RepID=UPI001FF06ADA|nr:hypothetical protein [Aquamicrobium sp. LC103]
MAYLLIAIQLSPDNPRILRTLAHLLILDRQADRALTTISRLERLEGADHPALALMKSRALLVAGEAEEARRSFRSFLTLREHVDPV